MPVTVTLDPRGEELIAAHLRTGRYHSLEEVVTRALEALPGLESPAVRQKTTAEAIAHIRESRRGVRLGGLKIKDLTHAGHKY